MKPKNPLAVVTGASSGIGFELAKTFAFNGFDLLITSEDPSIIEAAQSFRILGHRVGYIRVNLAEPDGVIKLHEKIQEIGEPVDVLAVNAGVGVGGDFARTTEWEDELNLINLNVISSVHLTKLIVKDMLEVGRGRVLITSSVASKIPGAFSAVYNASQSFLQSFAEAIRNELKDTEIIVTSLMPGATETNFFHRAQMDNTKIGVSKKDDPAMVAKQGFDALMKGKDHIIAGSFVNKIQASGFAQIIPETVRAELYRKQAEPGSAFK